MSDSWRSWRRASPGLASLLLFALVAASLLLGAFTVFATIRAERAEREHVARTNAVLDALRDIGVAVVNAETGQRGYLLTLDRRYLASYQLGAASYPEALRRLHGSLDSEADANQRQLMATIEQLADAKFGEMAETVSLVDDGRVLDARARVLSDEGQQLMVKLRATLAELEQVEGRLLQDAARESARSEARTLPLLGWLVALIVVALGFGLWLVSRTTRAEAAAANAAALAEARDRADLLAHELNHRVKNLFAVILAIVKMSARGDPEAKPVIDKIAQRIEALVRSHQITQGEGSDAMVDLGDLVKAALSPYRGSSARVHTNGDPIELPAKIAMPLGLVLHELTTNAVKYGALGAEGGALSVEWSTDGQRLRLRWDEVTGHQAHPPSREGFGSMLMSNSARQLNGSIDRTFREDGLEVRIEFALPPAAGRH